MKEFFREYWVWIVVPFALVIGGLLLAYFFVLGDEGASPFVYNIF
jgi:hypothetical protein